MHPVMMSADSSRSRDLPSSMQPSGWKPSTKTASFVRLSQLRKLRECEQVAAVCYRMRRGDIEFLLVQTRGGGRWTFPKGSTEPGLTHAQAAALEAFEEAGVHGRIEEVSFARYVLRRRRNAGKPGARSAWDELCINAHLCEVSRLSPPQESNRNRTWFSVQDATQHLREGRSADEGAAFARVIEKAVRRIQESDMEIGATQKLSKTNRRDNDALVRVSQKDALQTVRLESVEKGDGPMQKALPAPYIGRLSGIQPREILQAEILQFGPPRGKKTKILGIGVGRSSPRP
jgi:8-oxo-dGTP pyrophosphatase MutT (NUDIX family)